MNKKEIITTAWQTIVSTLKEMSVDNMIIIRMYTEFLESLPETTLILEEHRSRNSYIQGTTRLYSFQELLSLSDVTKDKGRLCFSFNIDDKATITNGWFNCQEQFSGSWLETLDFLVNKVYEANLRVSFSEGQKEAFQKLIEELKKREGVNNESRT
jgi:hypothetical protein